MEYELVNTEVAAARLDYLSVRNGLLQEVSEADQPNATSDEKLRTQTIELAKFIVQWANSLIRASIDSPNFVNDSEARGFIACCSETAAEFIDMAQVMCRRERVDQAQFYCEQANKILDVSRQVNSAWPWVNVQAVEEAWKQYHSGQLMDFESFKDAVQGITE